MYAIAALLDGYINGYQWTTSLFFGQIASEPDEKSAFEDALGYSMIYSTMATVSHFIAIVCGDLHGSGSNR